MKNRSLSPNEIAWNADKILHAVLALPEAEVSARIIFRIIQPSLECAFAEDPDLQSDLSEASGAKLQIISELVARKIVAAFLNHPPEPESDPDQNGQF